MKSKEMEDALLAEAEKSAAEEMKDRAWSEERKKLLGPMGWGAGEWYVGYSDELDELREIGNSLGDNPYCNRIDIEWRITVLKAEMKSVEMELGKFAVEASYSEGSNNSAGWAFLRIQHKKYYAAIRALEDHLNGVLESHSGRT